MQGIRQSILNKPRPLLPTCGILNPVRAVGNIRPGTRVGDAGHQRINITIHPFKPHQLTGNPVGGQPSARCREMPINRRQQPNMDIRHGLAKIGNLTNFPDQPDHIGITRQVGDRFILGKTPQRAVIFCFTNAA